MERNTALESWNGDGVAEQPSDSLLVITAPLRPESWEPGIPLSGFCQVPV